MRVLGLAIVRYSLEHNKALPVDMTTLATDAALDKMLFVSPYSNHDMGELEDMPKWSDLIYVWHSKNGSNPYKALIFAVPHFYGGDVGYVLYADGTAVGLETSKFNKMLDDMIALAKSNPTDVRIHVPHRVRESLHQNK